MEKKRNNGFLEYTYEVETVESSQWGDEPYELERRKSHDERWFEDIRAYAHEVLEKLRAKGLDLGDIIESKGVARIRRGEVQFGLMINLPTHKKLNALCELFHALSWYEKHPHPAHACEIGEAHVTLRALMDSKQVRLGQTNIDSQRKASVKGGTESKLARREAIADGYAEYAGLYRELRRTHTKWTDNQCFTWIADEHGERVARDYPGCGKSKDTVRRAVKNQLEK